MAFKCPECGQSLKDRDDLFLHIETEHGELLPNGFSGARYIFLKNHGRDYSHCSECGRKTPWNEATQKPHKFCSVRCKKVYRKKFEGRMIGKYNKICLLNDPDHQIKMMRNRKISGVYTWSNGYKMEYTGSYERDFLQFMDVMLQFEPLDVMSPAPQTFYYKYDGKDCFYIPDFYIASINTIVEIKDGGSNPNTHPKIQMVDKEKERLKDEVMKTQTQYNYIKITNKEYNKFVDFLIALKNQAFEDVKEKAPSVIIKEQLDVIKRRIKTGGTSNLYVAMYNGVFTEYAVMYDMELPEFQCVDTGNITSKPFNELTQPDKEVILFKYNHPVNSRLSFSEEDTFDSSEEFVNKVLSEHGIAMGIDSLIEDTNLMVPIFSGDASCTHSDILESYSEAFPNDLGVLEGLLKSLQYAGRNR